MLKEIITGRPMLASPTHRLERHAAIPTYPHVVSISVLSVTKCPSSLSTTSSGTADQDRKALPRATLLVLQPVNGIQ